MKGFVANTGYDWYRFLRSAVPPVDKVNFWRPGETSCAALEPGEPLFFKLKAPHNAIAGLGFFAHYSRLPLSMVWDVYGQSNGAATFVEMRDRLYWLRSSFDASIDPKRDFWIGCILLTQPVFFDEHEWVRMPDDFAKNIVAGKAYDLRSGEGARIWNDSPFSASASTPRRIQRSAVPSEGLTPFSPWISRASSAEQIGPRPESSRSGGALKRSRLWAGVSRARACTSSPRGEGEAVPQPARAS